MHFKIQPAVDCFFSRDVGDVALCATEGALPPIVTPLRHAMRDTVSLRLGHRSALTTIQVVIHSLAAANATQRRGLRTTDGRPYKKSASRRFFRKLLPRDIYGDFVFDDVVDVHEKRENGKVEFARFCRLLDG